MWLGQHHPDRRILPAPPDGVTPACIVAESPLRLLRRLDFGDEPARRRIPAGKVDARRLADHAAPTVAPDEILRAERLTVGEHDVDAGVVLREARHVARAVDA